MLMPHELDEFKSIILNEKTPHQKMIHMISFT